MEAAVITREEMDALVDAHIAAEADGDLEAAIGVYTSDIEHDVVGAPDGVLHGPAAVRERYTALLSQMQQDKLVPTRTYYGDDFCVVEHECTITVKGVFAGVEADGRQLTFRMLHIFEFAEGLIRRENVWMDSATMMAQLTAPASASHPSAAV